MTTRTALQILKGKICGDKSIAAETIANAVDPTASRTERENIAKHLRQWALGDSENVRSLKREFNAWYSQHGTYGTNA